ncbi:MAG: 1-acyl-sn-glycerol-3-phosphate acyltransferase [Planctomycetes bacterium]|nr:1-acyl-sn-glycerol-3-phosphate acyltransferase [Planctomycetota bacterium]
MAILDWLARTARTGELGTFSPRALRWLGPGGWLGGIFRLAFRPAVTDWEHLPERGPFLVVANHSGGGGADVATLATHWAETFGSERTLAALAHPLAFHCPGAAALLREFGAIPSSYERAIEALRAGVPVLVFPGGDHEAFRPIWQAYRVDFNRRQGFLRLAREAWIPIVPLGLRGSHFTVPILWRSKVLPWVQVLPRLLGLKRFPLTLAAIVGSTSILALAGPAWGYPLAGFLAWAWLSSPTNVLLPQIPWKVSVEVGAPIPPDVLFGPDRERSLDDAYDQVLAAVQALVLS